MYTATTRFVLLLALCHAACGCESLTAKQSLFSSPETDHEAQAEAHRTRFLQDRDSDDLNWLLVNAVRSGMSQSEVSLALGEEGHRVRDDARFKRNGGHYRENDSIWKWGPDNKGQSIFLAFRNGKLVNFDPGEFAGAEDGTRFIGDTL